MGMRTHAGSCHCGAVRFEVDADLEAGTVQCNCSLCTKQRNWAAMVPRAALRLLQGAAALTEYRCNTRTEQHFFCAACGVRTFGMGSSPRLGAYAAVSVACLDTLTPAQLAALPVRHLDGRNDDWS